MRIALLHPYSWPEVRRGGERYAHDLAWWLADHGHAVDYVTGAASRRIEVADGVRFVRLRHRHLRRLAGRSVTPLDSFGVAVLPWLLRHRYDVVHAMVPAAAVAAGMARQRLVFTAIGHPAPLADPGRRKDRMLARRAMRAAATVTVLSQSAADAAEALFGRSVTVVPPGVRGDVFTPELRARSGPPRVLFTADARDPRKRVGTLLAAMPGVLDALPEARLLLAGGGALPGDIDERMRRATDVIGAVDLADVPALYRQASVTVLPSVDEAFGLVLAESLACGTPVVGADSGGITDIVSPDVGELVPPDDPVALAQAIVRVVGLAGQPDTPQRCHDHAQQWDWDAVGPQHLSAYEASLRH